VENGIAILPVHLAHVLCLERLPDHHKDPFDRLLIAQALEEGFVLMTADTAISKYSVPVLW
jgi:PIN domain nuclease of toxin-antitoxin system